MGLIFVIIVIIIGYIYQFKYYRPGTFRFWKLSPAILVFSILVFFEITGRINDNQFLKRDLNSVIVKYSKWQVRTTEYFLSNNLVIYSVYNKLDLQINDSIVKKANTYQFDVYRKNNFGRYQFVKKCNYKQVK